MPKRIDFKAVIDKLKDFYGKERRLPSYSELQEILHYRSKGSVAALVRHLIERNIVRQDGKGRLVPTALFDGGARLLGTVQAGFPTPAEEDLTDTLSLDDYLVSKRESCYLLKVSGDSMIDAGILPGDLVVVERGRAPKNGDIVVAQVDGDWTLKYFEKKGGEVTLRAANRKYPPIRAREEIVVSAVVVGTARKY